MGIGKISGNNRSTKISTSVIKYDAAAKALVGQKIFIRSRGDVIVEKHEGSKIFVKPYVTSPFLDEHDLVDLISDNALCVYSNDQLVQLHAGNVDEVVGMLRTKNKVFAVGEIDWNNRERVKATLRERPLDRDETETYIEKYSNDYTGVTKQEGTYKNIILIALDKPEGFKEAIKAGDIDKMEQIYRNCIIGYEHKDPVTDKKKGGGQYYFFWDNHLQTYMKSLKKSQDHEQDYKKGGPIYALLNSSLPEIAERIFPHIHNDSSDIFISYQRAVTIIKNNSLRNWPKRMSEIIWQDKNSTRNLLFAAFDTVKGINSARTNSNKVLANKKIVKILRGNVFNKYEGIKDVHWAVYSLAYRFLFDKGFYGLLRKPRKYFEDEKPFSLKNVLNFTFPGIVNDNKHKDFALYSNEVTFKKIKPGIIT